MLPCGEVHWKILPAISRELAVQMHKEGVANKRIAEVFGTSSAAISQYVSGKRGGLKLDSKTVQACRGLARKLSSGKIKNGVDGEIAKILVIAKGSKLGKNDPCAICMGNSHS